MIIQQVRLREQQPRAAPLRARARRGAAVEDGQAERGESPGDHFAMVIDDDDASAIALRDSQQGQCDDPAITPN